MQRCSLPFKSQGRGSQAQDLKSGSRSHLLRLSARKDRRDAWKLKTEYNQYFSSAEPADSLTQTLWPVPNSDCMFPLKSTVLLKFHQQRPPLEEDKSFVRSCAETLWRGSRSVQDTASGRHWLTLLTPEELHLWLWQSGMFILAPNMFNSRDLDGFNEVLL